MDLGECPQIHDLALRADYEAAQKKKDHFYDIDVSVDSFMTSSFQVIVLYTLEEKDVWFFFSFIFLYHKFTFAFSKLQIFQTLPNIRKQSKKQIVNEVH